MKNNNKKLIEKELFTYDENDEKRSKITVQKG